MYFVVTEGKRHTVIGKADGSEPLRLDTYESKSEAEVIAADLNKLSAVDEEVSEIPREMVCLLSHMG